MRQLILAVALLCFVPSDSASSRSRSDTSDVCLSKKEARELWPRRHIYWYGSRHCWSNRRGPPRGIKIDPIIPNHAMAQAKPKLDDLDSKPDECCWPSLGSDTDANGNSINQAKTWIMRWLETLGVWQR